MTAQPVRFNGSDCDDSDPAINPTSTDPIQTVTPTLVEATLKDVMTMSTDCNDSDCFNDPVCASSGTETDCGLLDDDNDGDIDCDDSDCATDPSCGSGALEDCSMGSTMTTEHGLR